MIDEAKITTNKINKESALRRCPVTYTLDRIGGRWKALIVYQMINGSMRYSELKRAMPAITEKMLIQQLKELEADGLVCREVRPVVPPHVTYRLSEAGRSLLPVLKAMAEWGSAYLTDNTGRCEL